MAQSNQIGDDGARARAEIELRQVRDGGYGERWDRRWNDRWDDRWDGRRDHRWNPRWDRRWRDDWSWDGPRAWLWVPPRPYYYYYYAPRHRQRHHDIDAWDAIALGLFGALVYDALTDSARERHGRATDRALAAPVGESIIWSERGASGTVRAVRDGYAGQRYCREFQQTITVNGERQEGWGIACQEPDGSWRLVPPGAGG
jgi:surface antigen